MYTNLIIGYHNVIWTAISSITGKLPSAPDIHLMSMSKETVNNWVSFTYEGTLRRARLYEGNFRNNQVHVKAFFPLMEA